MKSLVVLLSLAVLCAAQPPPRPRISETFSVHYEIERHTNVTIFGSGFIARDADKGMGVENSTYTDHEMVYVLQRFDQKMEYFITNYDKDRCLFRRVKGDLPNFWGFLKQAKYVGTIVFQHVSYDVWEFYAAGIRLSLSVTTTEPNTPWMLESNAAQNLVRLIFQDFKPAAPDPKSFDVPPQCQ